MRHISLISMFFKKWTFDKPMSLEMSFSRKSLVMWTAMGAVLIVEIHSSL